MTTSDSKLESFFASAKNWPGELQALRSILLDCGLTEEFKWRGPCYTAHGGNIAILWDFKEGATLGFIKGVLLEDPHGLLGAHGQNSRSMRVIKLRSLDDLAAREDTIRGLIAAAMQAEKSGLKVELADDDFDCPDELVAALDEDEALAHAWEALTPGRRRGYVLHFSQAKQPATRSARILKSRDRILQGKGMHDR